jgi:hypothetical protein
MLTRRRGWKDCAHGGWWRVVFVSVALEVGEGSGKKRESAVSVSVVGVVVGGPCSVLTNHENQENLVGSAFRWPGSDFW